MGFFSCLISSLPCLLESHLDGSKYTSSVTVFGLLDLVNKLSFSEKESATTVVRDGQFFYAVFLNLCSNSDPAKAQ